MASARGLSSSPGAKPAATTSAISIRPDTIRGRPPRARATGVPRRPGS
jgi:hypothetical protein